jgi:hypothetical protein
MASKWVTSRAKGEKTSDYNRRAHANHVDRGVSAKKSSGNWLSKADYEAKTGRPGR